MKNIGALVELEAPLRAFFIFLFTFLYARFTFPPTQDLQWHWKEKSIGDYTVDNFLQLFLTFIKNN